MPIDDDAVGIVKWGTGAGASDFNTPADVGFAEADGWPLAYGTPGSGSEPQREVFNWQWRRMTALAVELLTHGGGLPWDSRISYLHPASVMGSDGMLYQSVQGSLNQDPTSDASDTYWQQVGITLSDADIKTAYERNANTNALTDALLALLQGAAPLSSPAFTGAVTVPDQTAGTNNGRAANTRFVAAALAALVASAPSTLDTLNELAAALGDDANFAATVTTQLGLKADTSALRVLNGTRAPTTSDGVDGNLWVRTDINALYAKANGAWRRFASYAFGTFQSFFALTSGNLNPQGIASDGSNLYVVDLVDDLVYVYSLAGTFQSSFALTSANGNSYGITSDGSSLYVVDATDDLVYVYSLAGTFQSSFALTSANTTPRGMASDGSSLYVVDANDRVYQYSLAGVFISSFALTSGNLNPQGIASDGSNLYVVDANDRVYQYSLAGVFISSFALTSGNLNPQGIASDGSNLYVVDLVDDLVYVYSL